MSRDLAELIGDLHVLPDLQGLFEGDGRGAQVLIAEGDLSQRVPVERQGTEASELGDALNAMMSTIEGAFAERAGGAAVLRRFQC